MSAGWYADPQVPGRLRYWDGAAWTEHVAPTAPTGELVPRPTPALPTYSPSYGAVQPVYSVSPKNPAVSLIVSLFIPGVGSMMNGDVGKGVGILLGWIFSWALTLVFIGFIGVVGFFIWGLVDAYTGAQKWNRAHGIIS